MHLCTLTKHRNIQKTNQNIILIVCGNNVNVLKCVCVWIHHDLCIKSAQTRCIRLTRAYDSCTSPQSSLPWLQSSTIKRSWFALSSRENVVCISYSGGMFWPYVQPIFHNALFRNNHRACVLKRNTLELIIHWKRYVSIYSLRISYVISLVFLNDRLKMIWLQTEKRNREKRFTIEIVFQ